MAGFSNVKKFCGRIYTKIAEVSVKWGRVMAGAAVIWGPA